MVNIFKKLFPFGKSSSSPQFEKLKEKLEKRHEEVKTTIWNKHSDVMQWAQDNFSMHQLTAGTLGGMLLLSAPSHLSLPKPQVLLAAAELEKPIDKNIFLTTDLHKFVPDQVRELTSEEEENIGKILSQTYGASISAELDGKRLNRSYGYIGAEQHLARFPGDSMQSHFSSDDEAVKFGGSGMAPGLGAYRYFAESQETMTQKENDMEKYYIAVQTFLAPGFMNNPKEIYDFFKFRKMLLINPENGKAIVTVIGDAGPASWTGKHLGGSPEVMGYLERFDGAAKGPVLYFFIDDKTDTIPLGPIQVK